MIERVMDTDEVQLWRGDCREVMASLPDNSVDSIVTDPPYELGFMGKRWDSSGIAFDAEVWAQALRVLKPGGHLLAFGGTRTWHRVAVAIEDAGFEIRDSIAWIYGQGFPKSMDVSKAIDKARDDRSDVLRVAAWLAARRDDAGLTNRDIDERLGYAGMAGHWTARADMKIVQVPKVDQWEALRGLLGFGVEMDSEVHRLNARKGEAGDDWAAREVTGSVAAWENRANFAMTTRDGIARDVAREGSAAAKWEGWGTSLKPAFEPIVFARKPLEGTVAANVLGHGTGALNIDASRIGGASTGRFPSNVLLDESQATALDEQSGVLTSGLMKARTERKPRRGGTIYGADQRNTSAGDTYADSGGASRFFYVAKAGREERPVVDGDEHSTVKPLTLMRYLVKLVTPPGGNVLEPFAGSGTTLEAAVLEGFRVIGAELDDDGKHVPLILKRLSKPLTPAMF